MKRKIVIIGLIGTMIFSMVACGRTTERDNTSTNTTKSSSNKKTSKLIGKNDELGNENINLVDGGHVCYKNDWLFFSVDGTLFKSRQDGSEMSKIYEFEGDDEYKALHSINVIKDWIYFSGGSDSLGTGLYKIKTDGTKFQKILSDERSGDVIVEGNYIYYKNMYKLSCNNDGSDKEKLKNTDLPTSNCNYLDGYFYYCTREDINTDDYHIYKSKRDGEDTEILYDRNVYYMKVTDDGWIYYNDNHLGETYNDLFKMRIDGSENQHVSDVDLDEYTVDGDYIYYITSKDGEDNLYKMKTDGTGEEQIFSRPYDEEARRKDSYAVDGYIYAVNDWIYWWKNGSLWGIKKDGSQNITLYDRDTRDSITDDTKKQEDTSDKKLSLNSTYETQYSEITHTNFPQFAFDYPSSWKIDADANADGETVIISNERGVEITYSHLIGVEAGSEAGGSSVAMSRVEAEAVGNSEFKPTYIEGDDYSDIGDFVVAKLKVTGELDMQNDTDYSNVDGAVSYGLIPTSLLGEQDVRVPYCIAYGWQYADCVSLIADSPDGEFTKDEEKIIINILKSFREE